ncbi:phosphoglyceromutase [Helicobacter fennelliae]|uniref:phosphoglycerate mutase (2,3-diphosphoglycerate-independent) n=1 Tax=Helicobacter fennelliae TaxID=215 RepID=A0A2X3GMM8_9HELI|nr:phosphoglyceromutase [Helicobacter fennelliae]
MGLPCGQMGTSEVGHMSIGSGRVLYQDLVRISLSIKNKELDSHPLLENLAKKSNNIHLLGLMSDGGVHSHIEHFLALAQIFADKQSRCFCTSSPMGEMCCLLLRRHI